MKPRQTSHPVEALQEYSSGWPDSRRRHEALVKYGFRLQFKQIERNSAGKRHRLWGGRKPLLKLWSHCDGRRARRGGLFLHCKVVWRRLLEGWFYRICLRDLWLDRKCNILLYVHRDRQRLVLGSEFRLESGGNLGQPYNLN